MIVPYPYYFMCFTTFKIKQYSKEDVLAELDLDVLESVAFKFVNF